LQRRTPTLQLLLAGGNRYSAYHVQQAVEKVTKALLLAQGIEAGIEHRLEVAKPLRAARSADLTVQS
jgi:HEPN domain-containing protein